MLEIRKSLINSEKEDISNKLAIDLQSIFNEMQITGILYLGYPLVNNGNDLFQLDALLISKDCGVIVFSLVPDDASETIILSEEKKQNSIKRMLHQKFVAEESLYDLDNGLVIKLNALTYSTEKNKDFFNNFIQSKFFGLNKNKTILFALDKNDLKKEISVIKNTITDEQYEKVISLIQDVIKLKSAKKRNITKENSKGYKLNEIEKSIATLDGRQEEAVISFFDGIQRIRGLAGSGKTIVLALKVAFYHSLKPDAKIAITFHSRSLKQQFKSLIERFCISKTGYEPNWNKIKIIHAWGSPKEEGIYYNFCKKYGLEYLNYGNAKYDKIIEGNDSITEFDFVCKKAISDIGSQNVDGEYDIIFIDEAQDLSASFLKLCYKILLKPRDGNKRIIYAYDELQKLDKGTSLPDPKEIFDIDLEDTKKQDLILYKCYRNSKQVLTTAHSLGFGIYREQGPVQFFDNPTLWGDIGYKNTSDFIGGQQIKLYRDEESSPTYFDNLFKKDEFISLHKFEDYNEQGIWIANEIIKDIKEEDLLPNDILVIYPTSWNKSKNTIGVISDILFQNGIKIYNAGEDSPDIFYKDSNVTITGIYRAKGNEVGMVYIINANECFKGTINDNFELQSLRNMLFTGITRSKAWVKVTGIGEDMDKLKNEFIKVKDNDYTLNFVYPTKDQIENMNKIYRDIPDYNKKKLKKNSTDFGNILRVVDDIKNGLDSLDNYPQEVQDILIKIM